MRKNLSILGALALILAVLAFYWTPLLHNSPQASPMAQAAGLSAYLPLQLGPEATPLPTSTPAPSATPVPSGTPQATATSAATPTVTVEPLPGNVVVNGSFELGWTDLPPAPGSLINQKPNGWTLTWLEIGQPLWDDPATIVEGVPESLHKLADQLPPDEQPGGSRPLILDGIHVYKMFHYGAPFGSQLYQEIISLPPGTTWRLTVPLQVHVHGDNDPWAAESGAWALTSATQSGGWVPAGDMGDHEWFYHTVEFVVPADGRVEVLIRVKSKWFRAKDFFIDNVTLQRLSNAVAATDVVVRPNVVGNSATWGPRALSQIPANELIVP